MHAVLLHLALTLAWMLLSQTRSLTDLLLGFIFGFLLIAAFRTVIGARSYVRRLLNFFKAVGSFLYAFVTANIAMARVVLFKEITEIEADFIDYDISGLRDFEIVLLSHAISLTPGTTSVEVSGDKTNLVIHCLDAGDLSEVRHEIDRLLKNPMLKFTRGGNRNSKFLQT
jgi:multicomponent Na+:H+ antiporter subunit E